MKTYEDYKIEIAPFEIVEHLLHHLLYRSNLIIKVNIASLLHIVDQGSIIYIVTCNYQVHKCNGYSGLFSIQFCIKQRPVPVC